MMRALALFCFPLFVVLLLHTGGVVAGEMKNRLQEEVDELKRDFHDFKVTYEKVMEEVLEENHLIASKTLARWEEEDMELAALCSTTPSKTCTVETAILQDKRQKEIDELAEQLPRKKLETIDKFLVEFFKLEVRAHEAKQELEAVELEAVEAQKLSAELDELLSSITKMISSLHEVVVGNVCFAFEGASQPLEPSHITTFDNAMLKALELAFIQTKVDAEAVSVMFLGQHFEKNSANRNLRNIIGTSSSSDLLKKDEGEEDFINTRELRRRSVLNVEASAGIICQCSTDGVTSDIQYRRKLETTTGRMLFSSDFLEICADVLKVEIADVFGDVTSVKSFHCSEFSSLFHSP